MSSKTIWLVSSLSVLGLVGGASGAMAAPGHGDGHQGVQSAFYPSAEGEGQHDGERQGEGYKRGHYQGQGHFKSNGLGHLKHNHDAPVEEAPIEEPPTEEPPVEEAPIEEAPIEE